MMPMICQLQSQNRNLTPLIPHLLQYHQTVKKRHQTAGQHAHPSDCWQLTRPLYYSIALWNVRSLNNKILSLQNLIYTKQVDLLCITEPWLTEQICNNEILPYGYNIFRRDRGSRGGGIPIAVSYNIPCRLIHTAASTELIAIQCTSPQIIVCCVYQPPASPPNVTADILHDINIIMQNFTNTQILVLGDLNFPNIDWNKLSSSNHRPLNIISVTSL